MKVKELKELLTHVNEDLELVIWSRPDRLSVDEVFILHDSLVLAPKNPSSK